MEGLWSAGCVGRKWRGCGQQVVLVGSEGVWSVGCVGKLVLGFHFGSSPKGNGTI